MLCLICALNSIIGNAILFPVSCREKQAWDGLAFTVFHKKNLGNKKRPLGHSLELKPGKLFPLVELRTKTLQSRLRTWIKTNIEKDSAYSALPLSSIRICLRVAFLLKIVGNPFFTFLHFLKFPTNKILKFVFPNFCQRKPNIKQTLIVYVPQCNGAFAVWFLQSKKGGKIRTDSSGAE